MKKLIKALFKYLFLLVFLTAAVFYIGINYRGKTRPLERFIQRNVMKYILPDTTGLGIALDTTLTAEEELALEIQERKNQLDVRSSTLDSLNRAIAAREDSVRRIRDEIITYQDALSQEEEVNLDKLAKVFDGMKPDEASQIMLQLNEQTVAQILYRMQDRQAGKIMGQIDPLRAADITNRLRRLKQQRE